MIYPSNFEEKLGFDSIRKMLSDGCLCQAGQKKVDAMQFQSDFEAIRAQIGQVHEMGLVLDVEDKFPLDNYYDATPILDKIKVIGNYPEPDEVVLLRKSLEAIRQLKAFFSNDEVKTKYPLLSALAGDVSVFKEVLNAIDAVIDKQGIIKDNASPGLRDIRQGIKDKQSQVNKRLQQILRNARSEGLTPDDAEITFRNGRPVIPVLSGSKRKLGGMVHDESASGKTSFIEPAAVVELNNAVKELEIAERREIVKILQRLADEIRPYYDELIISYDFLGSIDFIYSKARFARRIEAQLPVLFAEQILDWKNAVHPLLYLSHKKAGKAVVAQSLRLDSNQRILVISGPNAGGKSVCLKTIALLQYMLQCGLLIPVSGSSEAGVFENLFIDIGDEQSLDNDLSTYSSHLTNMKYMLRHANPQSAFFIDEFGTGTEPAIGGAIAQAILEDLRSSGAFGVVTTHYANIKHYASEAEGILNGAMLFDTDKIKPVYQLSVGKPGSSFAIDIARNIGLPEPILQQATELLGEETINFDKHLREIIRDKKYWETKRKKIHQVEKSLDGIYTKYSDELEQVQKERKDILRQAKLEAKKVLDEANARVEKAIREIRESQADKERTAKARQMVDELRKQLGDDEKSPKAHVDEKLAELRKAENRLHKHNPEFKKKPIKEKKAKKELEVGDWVKVQGMNGEAEILSISGNKFQVALGQMQMTVARNKLEYVRSSSGKKARATTFIDGSIRERKLEFKSEIDLRGKRADEALVEVQQFIDSAIMLTAPSVRILHGKGNGILRQLIRDYLQTIDVVRTVRDEHADRGGAGISIVEFSY